MGRPATHHLDEEQHENLSRCLSTMMAQAVGLRSLLRAVNGPRSRASLAAVALVEAVGYVMEVLLAEHDRVYGAEQHPKIRVQYTSMGRGE